MYSATFDVSRISEISVTTYLRTAQPSSSNGTGHEEIPGKTGGGGGSGQIADMGNSDLSLGGIRFTPDLESMVSMFY